MKRWLRVLDIFVRENVRAVRLRSPLVTWWEASHYVALIDKDWRRAERIRGRH